MSLTTETFGRTRPNPDITAAVDAHGFCIIGLKAHVVRRMVIPYLTYVRVKVIPEVNKRTTRSRTLNVNNTLRVSCNQQVASYIGSGAACGEFLTVVVVKID